MLNYSEMLRKPPFSMSSNEKEKWYLESQKILCKFHYSKCAEYKNIVDRLNFNLDKISNLNQIPFIPARLFKEINLKSSTEENIAITLTSSKGLMRCARFLVAISAPISSRDSV